MEVQYPLDICADDAHSGDICGICPNRSISFRVEPVLLRASQRIGHVFGAQLARLVQDPFTQLGLDYLSSARAGRTRVVFDRTSLWPENGFRPPAPILCFFSTGGLPFQAI